MYIRMSIYTYIHIIYNTYIKYIYKYICTYIAYRLFAILLSLRETEPFLRVLLSNRSPALNTKLL